MTCYTHAQKHILSDESRSRESWALTICSRFPCLKNAILLVTKLFQPHLRHSNFVPSFGYSELSGYSPLSNVVSSSYPNCCFYVYCNVIVWHVSTRDWCGFFRYIFRSLISYCKCNYLITYILLPKLSYDMPNLKYIVWICVSRLW